LTGTGDGDDRPDAQANVVVDEQFLHTTTSANVMEGWEELQSFFERFLGDDVPGAWALVEVTHRPMQKCEPDETGEPKPTGEWELVSTGTWKRDPTVETPTRVLAIAEELLPLEELVARQEDANG